MTIKELVAEAINNAHENGYEIEALTAEELARDFITSGIFDESVDVRQAIKNVHDY